MTLLTAFIRSVGKLEELVIASDSRLSGNGQRTDHAQKVFTLPRTDALFAFAGDTQYAYPLMMQMRAAIEASEFSSERRLPLGFLLADTLRVFQQSYDAIHGFPAGYTSPMDPPDNFFLIGGYDWETSRFKAWTLKYSPADGAFRYDKSISSTTHKYVFVGDDPEAVRTARQITQKAFGTKSATRVKVDMEPYHALSEIAADEKYPTVGGVPQLGKVYRHLNSQLFLVRSSAGGGDGDVLNHFAGRPVRDLERSSLPVFDPQLGFYLKERGGEDMVAEPA
jgi:hypothetical protein